MLGLAIHLLDVLKGLDLASHQLDASLVLVRRKTDQREADIKIIVLLIYVQFVIVPVRVFLEVIRGHKSCVLRGPFLSLQKVIDANIVLVLFPFVQLFILGYIFEQIVPDVDGAYSHLSCFHIVNITSSLVPVVIVDHTHPLEHWYHLALVFVCEMICDQVMLSK